MRGRDGLTAYPKVDRPLSSVPSPIASQSRPVAVASPTRLSAFLDDPDVDILASIVLMTMDGKHILPFSNRGHGLGVDRDDLVVSAETGQACGEDAGEVDFAVPRRGGPRA